MSDTYQLSGPASAAAGRQVTYTAAAQQKGSWDNVATFTTNYADEDANFTVQGPSTSITVAVVVPASTNQALSVSVSGNAITINQSTGATASVPTSTANDVVKALRMSAPVAALGVGSIRAYDSNGGGIPTAVAATALAGLTTSIRGTSSSAPLPKQHGESNSYN